MKYILVVQFPEMGAEHFDELLPIEKALAEKVRFHSFVDGRDMGREESNIFIHSDDPKEAFNVVKKTLIERDVEIAYKSAYREAQSNFKANPSAENRIALKTAYEQIPEYLHCWLGSLDEKDNAIRKALE